MENNMEKINTIDKELISQVEFCVDEVITDDIIQNKRLKDLKKATTLGNGYRRKVKLVFMKSDGILNQVETTIWAVGSTFVTLKAGAHIPINSIMQVDF